LSSAVSRFRWSAGSGFRSAQMSDNGNIFMVLENA